MINNFSLRKLSINCVRKKINLVKIQQLHHSGFCCKLLLLSFFLLLLFLAVIILQVIFPQCLFVAVFSVSDAISIDNYLMLQPLKVSSYFLPCQVVRPYPNYVL